MKTTLNHSESTLNAAAPNVIIRFSDWVTKRNLAHFIITAGMVIMLLWAGSYKMTAPGAEGIVPLVDNSPLISWHFKLFGVYHGSDLIGVTEWVAAILILVGQFKPQAGIIGAAVAVVMFFTTSTMVITTPGSLVPVDGFNYMSFLGLFLFKDIISLGAAFYLIGKFGHKANLALRGHTSK